MRPSALPPLADRYCAAINSLLRRELQAYTGELKRSAMARMAASPPEPDIVKGTRKVRQPLARLTAGVSQGAGFFAPEPEMRPCIDQAAALAPFEEAAEWASLTSYSEYCWLCAVHHAWRAPCDHQRRNCGLYLW
jgi:hypothetical protein